MARRPCKHCGSKFRTVVRTPLYGGEKELVVSTCDACGRELTRQERKPRGRSKTVNWALFECWTPELAWWLGVFYGDGNIFQTSNMNRVGIVGSESTGQNWLNLVAPGKTPKVMLAGRTEARQAYKDSVHLVQLMEDKFGFTPGPKTHDLKWPEDLPQRCLSAFVRGLWDSDGSIFINRRQKAKGNDSVRVSYSSVCLPFITRLRDEVSNTLSIRPPAIVSESNDKGSWYCFKWAGAPAMQVASWLYQDSEEHLRNEDRYEVFLEFVGMREEQASMLCHCGAPATHEGKCQKHWWDGKRRTGAKVSCTQCGKKGVEAKGLCTACYKRKRRADKRAQK
jgi:hypothetical protein